VGHSGISEEKREGKKGKTWYRFLNARGRGE